MLGLHEGPCLLVIGLERGALLLKGLGARRNIARRTRSEGTAVSALCRDAAGRRVRQRFVERHQRFTLERPGVAASRFAVGTNGGIDDTLRLRISDQRPLRPLQVGARLGDLPLEEFAGIGRSFVAALQGRVDEAFGDPVRDRRCELRRVRIKAELDQLAFLRDLGFQARLNDCRRALEPGRRIAGLRDYIRVVAEIELLGGAFGHAPAAQQANLRRHDIIWILSGLLLLRLIGRDLDRRRIDLERHPRAIDRCGQQRDDDRRRQAKGNCAQDQPAPMLDDPQERGEIEYTCRRIGPLSRLQGLRLRRRIGSKRPRPLVRNCDAIVHSCSTRRRLLGSSVRTAGRSKGWGSSASLA